MPTPKTPSPTPSGGAPILSYNVPQQVSYNGDFAIQLNLDSSYFLAQSVQGAEKKS